MRNNLQIYIREFNVISRLNLITLCALMSFLFSTSLSAQCPDVEIIPLQDVPGYPQFDQVNLCGDADTLSFIIYSGDPGRIVGCELQLNLPAGLEYGGFEFATFGGTSVINTNPDACNPQFIVDDFQADSLVVVNVGVKANCEVDLNNMLQIEYEFSYNFIDSLNNLTTCSETVLIDNEYNAGVKTPVLNLLSEFTPQEVDIMVLGDEYCQTINISQDGLSSTLDEFLFEIIGLDLSSSININSITANGAHAVTHTYDAATMTTTAPITSAMFVGNGIPGPDDTQFNTNEILALEICYQVDVCPDITSAIFNYRASYGCNDEECANSMKTNALNIVPTGSLMPTATTALVSAPTLCGADGEIALTITNPNPVGDSNKYTDLIVGFETCEKANLDITQLMIGGIAMPVNTFGWINDDLNIDFTALAVGNDIDGPGGLEDLDGDGVFDDIPAGTTISLSVFLGTVCGTGESDPESCPANNCSFSQFYVNAKTNCGVAFSEYPSGLADMNIIYGPTAISNPNEYAIPIGDPTTAGYDFEQFGTPGAKTQEIEFCYDFTTENFNGCTTGDIALQITFDGAPGYIYDIDILSAELSEDGGATYTQTANIATDTSWLAISDEKRQFTLDLGSDATNVCYKYVMEMDSLWCPPPAFWFGAQQVIETCNDAGCGAGGCEIVRACRTATFRGDAEKPNCDCVLKGDVRDMYRKNYGFTDASCTTPVTRNDVTIADQNRYLPGDTMMLDYYYIITDDYAVNNLELSRLALDLWFTGSTGYQSSIPAMELFPNPEQSAILEFSVNKVGTSYANRQIIDLDLLNGCNDGGYGFNHSFGDVPWDGTKHSCSNSSNDNYDGTMLRATIYNYKKVTDCGIWAPDGGDCLDEFFAYANYEAGDTINFTYQIELMKNPNRVARDVAGVTQVAPSQNHTISVTGYIDFLDENGPASCITRYGSDCAVNPVFSGTLPGDISSHSEVTLDNCGGSIEHSFYLNSEVPLDWFNDEFRPVYNVTGVRDPLYAPMVYCGNSEILNYNNGVSSSIAIAPDSSANLFCVPVTGYANDLCAIESGNSAELSWDPAKAGAKALGLGNVGMDSMKLKYDFCLICPDAISATDYQIFYDYSDLSSQSFDYACLTCANNAGQICTDLGYSSGEVWAQDIVDSMFHVMNVQGPNVGIVDTRTPLQNVSAALGAGAGALIASAVPAVSEEIQAIDICNPNTGDPATGVAASVTIPVSVALVDVYSDLAGTVLTTTLVSDDGINKTYSVDLGITTLAASACTTIYVGTTMLFCPTSEEPPAEVCVAGVSGCAPLEVIAALSAASGCGSNEVCYVYITGEVGLQTEWFDHPTDPSLCEEMTLSVRVKNVKETTLLDILSSFEVPPGMTVVANSWEVAYPGGPTTFGTWTTVPDPDIVSGNTYSYSDDNIWSVPAGTPIHTTGLEGISVANATADNNKVAFRFKVTTNCDEFLSGSMVKTETTAANPCEEDVITTGNTSSPGIIIDGADPAENAQLIVLADPKELNCNATNNTFGLTAINTSAYPTSNDVTTCITIPAGLTFVPNSVNVVQPVGYTIMNTTSTQIGDKLEVCFDTPLIGVSQSMKVTFDAAVDQTMECGEVKVGVDIKSRVQSVTCNPGPPTSCDVFVQNSVNPEITLTIQPPFIAENWEVFTECATGGNVSLAYSYDINHNGPDAMNQAYTVEVYKDINGDAIINTAIDQLLVSDAGTFSVVNGAMVTVSGSIDIANEDSCPIMMQVSYGSSCACDTQEAYFDDIKLKALSEYTEPISMCPGDCIDIEICDFVSVTGDSIPSATSAVYAFSIDHSKGNSYTVPTPNGMAGLNYAGFNDGSILDTETNMLFPEQSWNESGWIVANFGKPHNVTQITIGAGHVSGWTFAAGLAVYKSTPYELQYSHDGNTWTDSGLNFSGGSDNVLLDVLPLPVPIAAQYWRMSSIGTWNWGVGEWSFQGESVPFIETQPISQVGSTVTICLPDDVGIDIPWPVTFTTGTGSCMVSEVLEIWNTGADRVTLGDDLVICGDECLDLEVELEGNGDLNGATYVWTPTTGLSDPTIADPEVCNLTADITYIVDVTLPGGCVKSDTIFVDHQMTPTPTPPTFAEICANSGGTLEAVPGYAEYTWFEVIGTSEIQVAITMVNTYDVLYPGIYIYKAYDGISPCPIAIGEIQAVEISCEYNIGNYIWLDEDGDGDQDAGEAGIGGVTVYLTDDNGVVIDSTVTDFNGGYLFEGVAPGDYTVSVNPTTLPTGLDNETFDLDGNVDGSTPVTIVDEDNLDIDFGYNYAPPADTNNPAASLGAIGDFIWSDANGDGVQDPGEPGIGGVVVNLLDDTGAIIATTTTDASGHYIFDDLPAGVYSVEVDDSTLPSNFVTTPTGDPDGDADNISEPIVLAPGDVFLGMDFGYNDPNAYNIGDQIFLDTNADGVEDAGEPGIEGVTVALFADTNGNGVLDPGELPIATTTTDENGNYLFPGVSDGDYIVVVTDTDNVLDELYNTADPDGGMDEVSAVTIAGADDLDQDFGYTPEGHDPGDGMLGDFIFLDVNGDGTQDPGDSGLEGVVINLYDGMGNLIATTTTDENGQYLFGGLDADTYTIEVDPTSLPNGGAGISQSVDPDGTSDNTSTNTLAQGEVNLDQDFGYEADTPNTIGGTIWEDVDANGTLDDTAILFEGVTVVLYDDQGNVVATTVTDANGDYSFEGLPDGTYTVDVTDDANILGDYWKSEGTNPGADNNSQMDTNTVSVSGGSTDTTSDFGYYTDGASLGNFVWSDDNNDGIQDAGEAGIEGVVVTLDITYPDGTVVTLTDTTDVDGHYSFDNLLLDEDYNTGGGATMPTFELSAATPADYMPTVIDANANANDLADSEDPAGTTANPTQGSDDTTTNADPTMESPEASYDFGFSPNVGYAIGNYIWLDEDGDGDQDAGENGIGGVLVELLDDTGAVIATTYTDANGGYLFEDIAPGDYTVIVDSTTLPAGLDNQTFDLDSILDHSTEVTIVNEDNLDIDFGYNYAPPADTNTPTTGALGAIGDRIWNDANGDGVQDAGEAGIGGVTVNLLDDTGAVIATTTTDAAGNYIFDNLPAGVYSVEVDDSTLPADFVTTPTGDPDNDGDNTSDPIVLGPGDVYLDLDFGYNNPTGNAIGDMIFLDTNADGTEDAGDLPLEGVTVALYEDTNGNGVIDPGELPIATMATDENGNYLFDGLPDGDYIVAVTDTDNVTGGMTNTADPDGGADETSAVTLAGADDLDQDFGYTPEGHDPTLGMIGDFVFLDVNGDDTQDPGDQGIEGVKVELFDSNGALVATTTTDANGMYLFGALDADTYTVKVDATTLPSSGNIPAGLTQSVDPDGGNDNESTVTIAQGGIDLDQDFGYKAPTPNEIGGTIWQDMDANGTLDESNPPLFEGVTVVLYDDQGNVVGTTVTDANGDYSFPGLPDGTYTVDVTDDAGILADYWKSNGGNPGADNNSQPDGTNTVSVAGGQTDTTSDFGYYTEAASIGNTVWIDRNGDGIHDPSESPLPLVEVTLTITYPDGTVVTMVDSTDATGAYSFDNLLLDEDYATGGGGAMPTYELVVTPPTGFNTTLVDVNSNGNDMEDSDDPTGTMAIPTQGQEDVSVLSDPTMETIEGSYDFGFTFDCAAPIVHYAITNGAISNPGQTTDYFYQDSVQNLATYTNHTSLAQQNGVIRCIDYCEFGQWSYYFNSSDPDEYLFAIEHGTNVTPIEYIELCVDDNPADRYSVGSVDATYVMARDWFVRTVNDAPLLDAGGNPTTVNIRFYFPEEEFKEIIDQAVAQANIWGSAIPTVADAYWFKKEAWGVNTDIDDLGSALKPFDITYKQNAATTALGDNTVLGSNGSLENVRNHIQFNGISGFSGGTAAITIHNTALPVALAAVEADVNGCDVTLKWQAESETGFSHYVVEKSFDGSTFESIGNIEALQTVGTKNYDFTETEVIGNIFFRLKMLNLDGTYSYSNIIQTQTECEEEVVKLKLFPNPIGLNQTTLNVEFTSKREVTAWIKVTDGLGVEKMNFPIDAVSGENRLGLDISNLPSGSFILTLHTGKGKLKTQRFVKINE